MNRINEEWEDSINALLDGELSSDEAEQLKVEASDNRDLAVAIVEAYQLQQLMDTIHVEQAPISLRKRLRAIPRQHRTTSMFNFLHPRWVAALAVIPLILITVSLLRPETPSAEDIAQARHDMAIAFAYLDKAGVITGREIESKVGHTMANAVTDSVNKAIKSQNLYSKENEA